MITKRIIPCLDVRGGRVVKGTNFEGLQDVNDPVALAEYYSDNGADELVFYDITASHEGRKLFTDIFRCIDTAPSGRADFLKINLAVGICHCRFRASRTDINTNIIHDLSSSSFIYFI